MEVYTLKKRQVVKRIVLTKQGEFPYGELLSDGKIRITMANGRDLGDYIVLRKEQLLSLINDGTKSKFVSSDAGWGDGLLRISDGSMYPEVIAVTPEQFDVIRELGKELVG